MSLAITRTALYLQLDKTTEINNRTFNNTLKLVNGIATKSKCVICGISVCRLSCHLETMHGKNSKSEVYRAKWTHKRPKGIISDGESLRSYLRCCYTNEGKQCNRLVLKKHHILRTHGLSGRSKIAKRIVIKSKNTRIEVTCTTAAIEEGRTYRREGGTK